jgi:hypothetical protein
MYISYTYVGYAWTEVQFHRKQLEQVILNIDAIRVGLLDRKIFFIQNGDKKSKRKESDSSIYYVALSCCRYINQRDVLTVSLKTEFQVFQDMSA